MPAMVRMYELQEDGSVTEAMMFSVDAAHAVQTEPGRWFYQAPKVKAPEPEGEPEAITDLPALPRGRGRPPKDGGAA